MSENINEQVNQIDGGNLSDKERKDLAGFIVKAKKGRTPKQIKRDQLLSFQVEMLDYLENKDNLIPVGNFLADYIKITGVKKSKFAKDIDIHTTKLSNLLKDRVMVNALIAYKLEAHSKLVFGVGAAIKAMYWMMLKQKNELAQFTNKLDLKQSAYDTVKQSLLKS